MTAVEHRGLGSRKALIARRIELRGRVQGVGFRPFVFGLAQEFGIFGWVQNLAGRVLIHAEGTPTNLDVFERDLIQRAPPLATPRRVSSSGVDVRGAHAFEIRESDLRAVPDVSVPPDTATCSECREEVHDVSDRRFGYAFNNCTQCGPRYTIVEELPYDRERTTMAGFEMCPACREEYQDPSSRRFHAEPIACPDCGPSIDPDAWEEALTMLEQGGIIALKGLGGYHLLCDAASGPSVRRLRERKKRPHKPLAVMIPRRGVDDLDWARRLVHLSKSAGEALTSPAAPIVLCPKKRVVDGAPICDEVSGFSPDLGLMLPYSPLHELLLRRLARPLVATSANSSDEPLEYRNNNAEEALSVIADLIVHHDRPIRRPVDDSVRRSLGSVSPPVRMGRGEAPLEIQLKRSLGGPVLAVGGHMKNAVALGIDDRIVVAPHIGDLSHPRSMEAFIETIETLQRLFRLEPEKLICDLHPDYGSTRWAHRQPIPTFPVQHHRAHASSLVGGREEDVLVFAWDGVGLGDDGTLWGGEAFWGRSGRWERVASMLPLKVLGAGRAGREPWRSAAAAGWATGCAVETPADSRMLREAWDSGLGCLDTSAVGRLFDAAAYWILGMDAYTFEAQGPMCLEGLVYYGAQPVELPLEPDPEGVLRFDWRPLVPVLANTQLSAEERSSVFHASLVETLVAQVSRLCAVYPVKTVGLSGGVFQNRSLYLATRARLEARGIEVLVPRVPINDGGIAVGQIYEYAGADHG